MFEEKIPSLEKNEKILNSLKETRYARLNWTHHLKPLAKEVYSDFLQNLKIKGYREVVFFDCLSDSVEKNENIKSDKDIYGDSISIRYSWMPVPVEATWKINGMLRVLEEEGASLVFSMGVNGSVCAFIYPQKTKISRTKKRFYIIGEWRNSAEITRSDLRWMMEFLFEIQTYCGIYCYGKFSERILARLSAKDESIRFGTNKLMRYAKYISHLITGFRRIYGVGPSVN